MQINFCKLVSMNTNTGKQQTRDLPPKKSEDWAKRFSQMIGENLKKFRTEVGLSAQKLSDTTNELGYHIPRNAIANLENGRRETVSIQELEVLSEALEYHGARANLTQSATAHELTFSLKNAIQRYYIRANQIYFVELPEFHDHRKDVWNALEDCKMVETANLAPNQIESLNEAMQEAEEILSENLAEELFNHGALLESIWIQSRDEERADPKSEAQITPVWE